MKRRRKQEGEPSAEAFTFAEETNIYADDVKAAHKLDFRTKRIGILVVVLVVIFFAAMILPDSVVAKANNFLYRDHLLSVCVQDVMENVSNLASIFTGAGAYEFDGSWLVRYAVIALAGAGLALSGAVYQGAFRNALVSPSTLGVMTGANFGLMIWVLCFSSASSLELLTGAREAGAGEGATGVLEYLSTTTGLAVVSFAGCLIVVGLVLLVNKISGGGTSAIVMIITGQMVAGVLGAVNGVVRYYYTYTDPYGAIAEMLTEMQIASFYRSFGVFDLVAIFVPLAMTYAVVMHLHPKMMLLAFDEGEQRAMGVNTKRIRTAVIALCTLLTAIIVSFCGQVGFVGFLVPHLARRIVGPNFKYLLPASTVLGAIFVLGAYVLLNTTLGGDYTEMTGMYISIAGAAVFFVTALRGRGASLGKF